MKVVLEAVPVLLFLLASFSLLSLLVMLPVAMFAPAEFAKSPLEGHFCFIHHHLRRCGGLATPRIQVSLRHRWNIDLWEIKNSPLLELAIR